jgi:hypothetical protein
MKAPEKIYMPTTVDGSLIGDDAQNRRYHPSDIEYTRSDLCMVWQPMRQKPTECGWYLVWRKNTDCQAEAYYDTDKGWMSAYSYTEGGCTKMYSDATHFMLIKPPENV